MGIRVFVADPHVGIEVSHGDSSLMTSPVPISSIVPL